MKKFMCNKSVGNDSKGVVIMRRKMKKWLMILASCSMIASCGYTAVAEEPDAAVVEAQAKAEAEAKAKAKAAAEAKAKAEAEAKAKAEAEAKAKAEAEAKAKAEAEAKAKAEAEAKAKAAAETKAKEVKAAEETDNSAAVGDTTKSEETTVKTDSGSGTKQEPAAENKSEDAAGTQTDGSGDTAKPEETTDSTDGTGTEGTGTEDPANPTDPAAPGEEQGEAPADPAEGTETEVIDTVPFTGTVKVELEEKDKTLYYGDEVTLKAVVENANKRYTVRWESREDDKHEWKAVGTGHTYKFKMDKDNVVLEYRAVLVVNE